jgi:peptide/nickel transport system substrate-binding protein
MDSIEAVDDTHVVLRTTQPTSLYLGNYLYAYILPEHIWEGFDRPKQFDNYPNVGSGPFLVEEWRTGEFIRMVRNPEWTGPEPYVDEVVWRYFKSEDSVAEALKAGEIDFAYFLAPNVFNSVKDESNIDSMVGSLPSFDEIGMNTGSAFQDPQGSFEPHGDGHPALADVTVRRAIRMAINSQELSDKVWLGYAPPGDTIVPPITISGARWEPTGDDLIPWDIEGANAVLEEAGYVDTDGDGVREMPGGGEPLEFRYFVRTSDQTTVDAAPFVQSWLEQIGIKAEVTAMSSGRLGDVINAGEYDLFDWGWIPDIDPNSILSYFTCDQRPPDGTSYGNNDSYYCNPDYDELFLQQQSELDPQARLDMIHELQRIYYEDAAYAVKWYSPLLQAFRTDTFTGYIPQPQPEGDLLTGYSRDAILSIRPVGLEGDEGGGGGGNGGGGGPGTGAETRGISAGVWIGIIAGVVLVVIAVVLLRRRRPGEDEA